jgi:SNF2-related domain
LAVRLPVRRGLCAVRAIGPICVRRPWPARATGFVSPAGPLPVRHRVYLSAATLVVVPNAELVDHWEKQIRWHTLPGALRVATITTGAAKLVSRRRMVQGFGVFVVYKSLDCQAPKPQVRQEISCPQKNIACGQLHWA